MRDQRSVKSIKSPTTRGARIAWRKDFNLMNRSKDGWISPPMHMEEISG